MSADAKVSVAFAVSWIDYLTIEKNVSTSRRGYTPDMIEDSYASVVVSMILNGRSLILMYAGIPAAKLGLAAAAGSEDDDTSLHFPRI